MMKIILIVVLLAVLIAGLMAIQANIGRKGAEEFATLISEYRTTETNFVLLDIRTLGEFQQGHIEGASQLDFYSKDFKSELSKLEKEIPYLIYCRSGNRSGQALRMFNDLGFTNVQDLQGGIKSWVIAGNKLVKEV